MKKIFFYANQEDMRVMMSYFFSRGMIFYSYYGEQIDCSSISFDWKYSLFYMFSDGGPQNQRMKKGCFFDRDSMDYIEFQTPFIAGLSFPVLEFGMISLKGNTNNPFLAQSYEVICKYIKSKYSLSADKMYYYSKAIEESWEKRELHLPMLLKYYERTFISDEAKLEQIEQFVKRKGFEIEQDGRDIRESFVNNSFSCGTYVISPRDAFLRSRIISRKRFYSFDSECIWMIVQKKKTEYCYRFLLDTRLADNLKQEMSSVIDALMAI